MRKKPGEVGRAISQGWSANPCKRENQERLDGKVLDYM